MRELFEQEYQKYENSLFLVAVAYLHNTEDAKDAVQEAALSAYKSIDQLRQWEYFKTWLTRIVINKCKNILRAQKYTEELTDQLNVFCSIPTADMEILDSICRMDKAKSIFITLRFYNDMTYEEVAKTLGQPVSTVKFRTKRALAELKTFLEGDEALEHK